MGIKQKQGLLKNWPRVTGPMGCSKLLAEEGYDILILKVEQDLLKNWPQVCGRAYRASDVQSTPKGG